MMAMVYRVVIDFETLAKAEEVPEIMNMWAWIDDWPESEFRIHPTEEIQPNQKAEKR